MGGERGAMKKSWMLPAVVGVLLVAAAPTMAQSDLQALAREVERLRADLVDLQRFLYAGEGELPVPAPSTAAGPDIAPLQQGLQRLEESVRQLTGRIEETEHRQRQLLARMDGLIGDLDARFAALEGGTVAAVPDAAATDTATAAPDAAAAAPEGESVAAATVLPPGSAMERYNFAFSLLRKADYEAAEAAFVEFIALYPDNELTGNAYYWLGSVHFVRDRFRDAAVAFLKGYSGTPTGPKAADNLFKLGAALSRDGKLKEACAVFEKLDKEFPGAARALLDEAAVEAAAAGCG